MATKWVYMFKEGDATMRNLLGGKGANLAEMTNLGLPVPQGFTITTEACTQYYEDGRQINDEIMKELSQIIRAELKDPRIGVMTSVIRVETTQDLKYCKVYVSVLGDEKDKENVMKGLQNAGGFIRRLIAQRINLRYTPELRFKLDESAEYAIHMDELFSKIDKERKERDAE